MKNKINKFLSCVLAICMIASFVPVYAIDEVQSDNSEVTIINDSEVEVTNSEVEIVTDSESENTSSEIGSIYEVSGDAEIDDVATQSDATEQIAGSQNEEPTTTALNGPGIEVFVDPEGNGAPENDGSKDKPFKTIERALEEISDVGTIYIMDNMTIDTLNINNKDITIQSYNGDYSISKDGSNLNMFYVSDNGSLSLKTVTIDAKNEQGYTIVVDNQSVLNVLDDTRIVNNERLGAIFNRDSTVNIYDGEISNNKVLDISEGNLSGNYGRGGVMSVSNGTVNIYGGTMQNNYAEVSGGVIYLGGDTSSLNIQGGSFINNKANTHGGAIFVPNTGTARITISGEPRFERNVAETRNGGALGSWGKLTISISGNPVFVSNEAGESGGAIYINNEASTVVSNGGTYIRNHAGSGGAAYFRIGNAGQTYTQGDAQLIIDSGLYQDNEAVKNGGAIYINNMASTVILNGGTYTGNHAGFSGGAAYVQTSTGSQTYVQGDAQIIGNSADVNAGAISFKRSGKGNAGTATLVDCDIIDNWCNAEFDLYTGDDLEPTKHYNTGGVYVAEDVVLHIYDGLVTENYIESGYDKNMAGSGIGLCPNANAYFYPEHGALVYNNGEAGTETMDIVAVPYDETITHETPAKLYISDMTPDGRNYNWTDFDGEKARTGEYNWDGVLNEKLSGISLMAMANNSGYQGEDNLNPVGFKANINGAQNNPEIMTMDLPLATGSNAINEFEPKVIIKDNYTKSALYGAGGIMVNGTVIAGEFTVDVEKTVEFNGPVSQEKKNEILAQDFEFEFIISGDYIQVPANGVAYRKYDSNFGNNDSGTLEFTSDTDDDGKQYISAKFILHGDQKISIGPIKKTDIDMQDGIEYLINVVETDSKGATNTEYTYSEGAYLDGSRESVKLLEFTCKNTYDFNGGSLSVEKLVKGKDGDLNKMFDFSVELNDKTISGSYGEMEFSNGVANFQLKNGDKKTATGLPVGVTYTVNETNTEGYTTTSSGTTGAITENGLAEAVFTNTRDTGNLSITKTLEGNVADSQKDWHFTVTLNDDNGVANITGIYGDMEFTNGVADVVVKGGTTKTATGLPTGLTYTVEEVGANTDGYETSSSNETGKIEKDQTAAVSFTNKKSTGSLTVTKTVKTAVAADRTREWNFTITLSGKNSQITGQYDDMNFTDGVAHFTLKDGQSKTAKDLPAGVTYKVTEETDSDFETSMENESGEITEGGTANVSFTNSRHITLPNTGASSLYIICMLAGVLAFVGIVIKKKNNK